MESRSLLVTHIILLEIYQPDVGMTFFNFNNINDVNLSVNIDDKSFTIDTIRDSNVETD